VTIPPPLRRGQLDEGARDAALAAQNLIAFEITAQDARALSGEFGNADVEAFVNQPVHHAMAKLVTPEGSFRGALTLPGPLVSRPDRPALRAQLDKSRAEYREIEEESRKTLVEARVPRPDEQPSPPPPKAWEPEPRLGGGQPAMPKPPARRKPL